MARVIATTFSECTNWNPRHVFADWFLEIKVADLSASNCNNDELDKLSQGDDCGKKDEILNH